MALSFAEFVAAVSKDTLEIGERVTPTGISACSACGIPLQETITGNRPDQHGSCRCSDCYFDALGEELDAHPLGAARPVRGA